MAGHTVAVEADLFGCALVVPVTFNATDGVDANLTAEALTGAHALGAWTGINVAQPKFAREAVVALGV